MRTKLIAVVALVLLIGSVLPVAEAKKTTHQVTDYDIIKQKYVDGSITFEQFISLTRPKNPLLPPKISAITGQPVTSSGIVLRPHIAPPTKPIK